MCKRERYLDEELQSLAVDGRVHVLHRPMKEQGDNAQLDTTFAYIIERDTAGDLWISYAVARRNPKDNFCRRIGRIIAKGRLADPKACPEEIEIDVMPQCTDGWRTLDDMIVQHYMEHSYV